MEQERDVEQYFKNKISRHGAKSFKWTSTIRGVPDQIVILPNGRSIFVEMKKPNGKARKSQLHFHQKLRELGHYVFICYSKAEADNIVNQLEDWGWIDGNQDQ